MADGRRRQDTVVLPAEVSHGAAVRLALHGRLAAESRQRWVVDEGKAEAGSLGRRRLLHGVRSGKRRSRRGAEAAGVRSRLEPSVKILRVAEYLHRRRALDDLAEEWWW